MSLHPTRAASRARKTSVTRRDTLAIGLSVTAAALSAPLALAQTGPWPNRQVRIVVPFPPGGSTDLLARRIGEKLSASLGQPVIVENRAGAGGTTGADAVAKSPADGYTLLMGVTGSNAVAASLFPRLPYDPVKDFTPVSLVVSAPLVLVVNSAPPSGAAGFSPKTLREYITVARANAATKPVNYASPGNGTSMHLTGEMFEAIVNAKLQHIPYRGSAAAMNDLLGGQIQSMFGDILVTLPQIRAGKLTALAVSSARRHPLLPDVPTIAESAQAVGVPGLAGFEATSWQGLFAPANTPREIVQRLNAEVLKALDAPDLKDAFAAQGFIVSGSTPEAFRTWVESEVVKWGRIVRAANVQPD